MALHKCATPRCARKASGRNIFCMACWDMIPRNLREDVRKGTEKGLHTLKANPSREWRAAAVRYTETVGRGPSGEIVISA